MTSKCERVGRLIDSDGWPDTVKELHNGVVDHERYTDVHADPTKSRNRAFIEPAHAQFAKNKLWGH